MTQESSERPRPSFQVGQRFTLSEDALENYGEQYRGQIFTIIYWADHDVSSKEYFDQTSPLYREPHGHPGFDGNDASCLYGSDFPSDLYEWEMEAV